MLEGGRRLIRAAYLSKAIELISEVLSAGLVWCLPAVKSVSACALSSAGGRS